MIDTETNEITNSADIIDSRDVIARIEALRNAWNETTGDEADDYALSQDDWSVGLDDDEAAEIVALLALTEQCSNYVGNWEYGATLIREDYFTEYAQQLADDLGLINSEATWPNSHIDWDEAAESLKQDYTSVEFDGVTYYVR